MATKKRKKEGAAAAPPKKHSNQLRVLRERGIVLSMAQVAKLIGQDEATVSRHETGARSMNRDQIVAYAKLYGVETHELFMENTDSPTDIDNPKSGDPVELV